MTIWRKIRVQRKYCIKIIADEGNFQVKLGYRMGTFRPWRYSCPFGNSTGGDSEKEPFKAKVAELELLSMGHGLNLLETPWSTS
ncbi:hypothetical protein GQ457_05G030500 [Hibiscus cannabinus]